MCARARTYTNVRRSDGRFRAKTNNNINDDGEHRHRRRPFGRHASRDCVCALCSTFIFKTENNIYVSTSSSLCRAHTRPPQFSNFHANAEHVCARAECVSANVCEQTKGIRDARTTATHRKIHAHPITPARARLFARRPTLVRTEDEDS